MIWRSLEAKQRARSGSTATLVWRSVTCLPAPRKEYAHTWTRHHTTHRKACRLRKGSLHSTRPWIPPCHPFPGDTGSPPPLCCSGPAAVQDHEQGVSRHANLFESFTGSGINVMSPGSVRHTFHSSFYYNYIWKEIRFAIVEQYNI